MAEKKQIVVDCDTEDSSFRSYAKKISTDGVLLETGESSIIGQEISLTFSSDYNQTSFMVTGKVVNRLPKGIEVEFENLTQREQSLLLSLSEIDGD